MAHICDHSLHKTIHHHGWDRDNAPVLTIAPGETVAFPLADSFRPSRVQKTSGDGFRQGEPGDRSRLHRRGGAGRRDQGDDPLGLQPSGWGWTANIPGFGLLADQFSVPALHVWSYETDSMAPAAFGPGGRVPLQPFCGTIGLAPAEAGNHSVVPPRRVGGNMDIRDIGEGTELWLPVEVAGGLFSVGDTHAAQGDREVCGTAIESPMSVALNSSWKRARPRNSCASAPRGR